ncbi:MAG: hypothetical protein ACE5K0_12740 [Candidatus Methanofastidiosia archaeon]
MFWLLTINSTYVYYLKPNVFLGILSELPIYFWIALIFVVFSFKKTFEIESEKLLILNTMVLILILFVTFYLIEPNARHGLSYRFVSIAKGILQDKNLVTESYVKFQPYIHYSGFPIFAAVANTVLGISLETTIKYSVPSLMPLIAFYVIVFNRLILPNDMKGSVLSTAFFFSIFWFLPTYFGPQFLSYVLFLLFLNLFTKNYFQMKDKSKLIPLLFLIFISIQFVHPLMGMEILSIVFVSMIISFVLKKDKGLNPKFLLGLGTIYIVFTIYIATVIFETKLLRILSSFYDFDIFWTSLTLRRESIAFSNLTTSYGIVFLARFFFILSGYFLSFLCLLKLIRLRDSGERDSYVVPTSILFASILLFPLGYGGEIFQRIYFFSTISFAFFIGVFLRHSRFSFVILTFFILLHPIAYVGDESFRIMPDSTLELGKYFVKNTLSETEYLIEEPSIVYFYDPHRMMKGLYRINIWNYQGFPSKGCDYVLRTIPDEALFFYYLGFSPILENLSYFDENFDKLYDNGKNEIFMRAKPYLR